jgi:hypothetical protein
MSASTPKTPASSTPASGEQVVYVKLPPPGSTQAKRPPQNVPNPLLTPVLTIFAAVLCLSLPLSSGVIMVLLANHSLQTHFPLLWLWVPMFLFVEPIAILVAWGIWREYSGWRMRRDYLR